ncbi:MAG: hypothetical protein [Wendovervirus sonii]|uniref:Uncharacterized protein n=1 Tax=phage Lak_Megaphage_Sonny TaxID=3109229 RepID=A0ABZ0Z3P8_9CAUD|nr:MAG: hypothetical protein [phage Lak_Megaphage_Sonny]
MINEKFVLTFKAACNKLSDDEIRTFENAAGYSSSMSIKDKIALYEDIHAVYDITLDELEEDENDAIMPTYSLIMHHMKTKWFK